MSMHMRPSAYLKFTSIFLVGSVDGTLNSRVILWHYKTLNEALSLSLSLCLTDIAFQG